MLVEDVVSIKQYNVKKLLTSIRFCDDMTKKDISAHTSLSIATISNLCGELVTKGILAEGRPNMEMRVGRTPNLMKFQYDRYYVLALDFQFADIIGISILNLRNEILFSDSFCVPSGVDAREIIETAKQRLEQEVARLKPESHVIGVGASVPAIYDRTDERIKCSSIARYEGIPLKKMLGDAFDCPAYVDNCANLRAISAYAFQPAQSIVCLDVSQGVGGGIVLDGEVLRGKNGFAAELAHIPIGDPAKRCPYCGGFGCVENDLGVENIVKQFPEIDQGLPLPEKWALCVAYFNSHADELAPMLSNLGRLLGQVASILIDLFDPNRFCLTGYITDIFPLLSSSFWAEINLRAKESLDRKLSIDIQERSWSDVYIGIADAMYHRWLP